MMDTTTAPAAATEPYVMIIVATFSLIGIVATGWFSYKGMTHAKTSAKNAAEANDSVNHRHPGQDRLFDMVASTRDAVIELTQWKDKWDGAPTHVASPDELATHFAIIEDRIKVSAKDTTDRIMKLHTHVDTSIGDLKRDIENFSDRLDQHIADLTVHVSSTTKEKR